MRDSRLSLVRASGGLRLLTDKKNKPRVDYEPRSAHGCAVKKMNKSRVDYEPRSAHGRAVNYSGRHRQGRITSAHVLTYHGLRCRQQPGHHKNLEKNGNLNSRPGIEQWPRQTTSGDLVVSLQLVFA